MNARLTHDTAVPGTLSPDAREALSRAGLSRRTFLKQSGALIVTFSGTAVASRLGMPGAVSAQGLNGPGSAQLDAWLAVGADGRVTAYTGKCELGQGLYTAQTQLVAEELRVPIERVTLIQCETGVTPDQGTTSGAQSHPANFTDENLALAAATAREALIRLAAERLGVPADRLVAENGAVVVAGDAARRVAYADLIGGRRFDLPLDARARRRSPAEWTVLGKPVPRLDLPAMATGSFEFVHNVRVAGMLHGAVVRPPRVGATLLAVDEGSIRGLPGVVRVVVRGNFVGVVAEKPWQAIRAARALAVSWSEGERLPAHDGIYEYLRMRTPRRDRLIVDSGDVDERLAGAARVVKATYHYPYQMHGSLGTSCAVADVRDDGATVWSATQAVYPMRSTVAMLLGIPSDRVRVVFRMGSGCYGINGADTVTYDAALLSQAVGRPVRVQLLRGDEMAWENFGLAYVIDQRAALDGDVITAWDCETWNPTRGGRPGATRPGNVVTGYLAGFEPAPFQAEAASPPRGYNNGSNAVPSYVTGCAGGVCGGTGTIRCERVLSHVVESPFWTGPLRSPSRIQNTFAHECFMDEIAAAAGADPVAFRLKHIRDTRLRDVLTAAAKAAGWEARPSPRPGIRRAGVATGRGVSCVLYEGDNGYCAMVAEVEVDWNTGRVLVSRCVVAIDCGPVSNPDGLRNQIEGGVIQGISRTLREEVTWDDRRVTSVDWRTYRPWYLGDPVPAIETVLVSRNDAAACGAGETSVTVTPAAIGNAIFDATGVRVREIPFTPERVKRALDGAGERRAE